MSYSLFLKKELVETALRKQFILALVAQEVDRGNSHTTDLSSMPTCLLLQVKIQKQLQEAELGIQWTSSVGEK